MGDEDQKIWREALERLREVDRLWPEGEDSLSLRGHEERVRRCRDWIGAQPIPRLSRLAFQLVPGLSRQQFWCALVPVERSVTRCKVTDVDILDRDLEPDGDQSPSLMPVTVLLDSLRSAFNVGGIFRTAECFGIREILLCGYTATPDQPQVAKAALGTEKRVAWRSGMTTLGEIGHLRDKGIACIAAETVGGACEIDSFEWPFPCALVLGNERFGLPAEVVRACSATVRIPLYGLKNSLNVGSAFAIIAQTLRRQFERAGRATCGSPQPWRRPPCNAR